LNQTVAASNLLGFANYLDANPLPSAMTCFYPDGEAYIVNLKRERLIWVG
jgi:hypothetical protein